MPFVQFTTLSSNVHEVTQVFKLPVIIARWIFKEASWHLIFYHIIETRFHEADENGNCV